MNDNNGDGILKFFLGAVIVIMFGFMGWAVMEHYRDHEIEDHRYYNQINQDGLHHNERMRQQDRHNSDIQRNIDRQGRQPYYCPTCRGYHRSCPHARQYDPYHNNGYYYCPTCRRMTRGCQHARHYNPYFGLEIQIR
jgi:hypothetical protein